MYFKIDLELCILESSSLAMKRVPYLYNVCYNLNKKVFNVELSIYK